MNNDLRIDILNIIKRAKEGHIPSSYSVVDIIKYIYDKELKINNKNFKKNLRDYFILSKGHAAAALFVVLKKKKFLKKKQIDEYGKKNSILGGHPECTKTPGVDASTGSLGHGFPFSVGIALGLKLKKTKHRVITLVGDGECHEGTVWEAANIASNQKLDNLTVIVDKNRSSLQLMKVEDLKKRWEAFGWKVVEADGHNLKSLSKAFKTIKKSKKPKAIIAKTTKGKGVKFLEGHGSWHHKIPNKEEYNKILNILKK